MNFFRKSKGQSIVEFALILGFVASISYYAIENGILDSVASLYPPAAKILRAVDHTGHIISQLQLHKLRKYNRTVIIMKVAPAPII